MTLETFVIWCVVGLIAGWLASLVVGGSRSIVEDILVGVVGAFIGGLVFRSLGASAPFSGMPGTIVVALIGSIILLVVVRAIRTTRRRT